MSNYHILQVNGAVLAMEWNAKGEELMLKFERFHSFYAFLDMLEDSNLDPRTRAAALYAVTTSIEWDEIIHLRFYSNPISSKTGRLLRAGIGLSYDERKSLYE